MVFFFTSVCEVRNHRKIFFNVFICSLHEKGERARHRSRETERDREIRDRERERKGEEEREMQTWGLV